jgi:hypothetical protein
MRHRNGGVNGTSDAILRGFKSVGKGLARFCEPIGFATQFPFKDVYPPGIPESLIQLLQGLRDGSFVAAEPGGDIFEGALCAE